MTEQTYWSIVRQALRLRWRNEDTKTKGAASFVLDFIFWVVVVISILGGASRFLQWFPVESVHTAWEAFVVLAIALIAGYANLFLTLAVVKLLWAYASNKK